MYFEQFGEKSLNIKYPCYYISPFHCFIITLMAARLWNAFILYSFFYIYWDMKIIFKRIFVWVDNLVDMLLDFFCGEAMAPHSSTLVWKIPWTEEPGGLQSMGLVRVGHDWVTSLSLFTFVHWRRKWQPTPAFLPGESEGRGSLVGYRLCSHTELDTTEAT